MTRITIEIPDIQDVDLIKMIMNRMGFPIIIQQGQNPSQSEIARLKSVIRRGVKKPSVSLTQRLQDLEEDSEDRVLPYNETNR